MRVTANLGRLVARIAAQQTKLEGDSPELRSALTAIGLVVSSTAKINVRRRGLIDTGNLLNSIRFQLTVDGPVAGVEIGSFGVPYARVHEFGWRGVVVVRGHTRRTPSGGTTQVRPHQARRNIRERPYLRPAVLARRGYIIDTMRRAMLGGDK